MDTHAIINLHAIRHNARVLSEFANKPVLAPIKANAYGHGATQVAQTLEPAAHIVGFAVATASEVLELRAAGITKDIVLLTPACKTDLPKLIASQTSFVVSSSHEIQHLHLEASAQNTRVRVHLKINTGLNRLGTHMNDAAQILLETSRASKLELYGIMTHLTDSEDANAAHATQQIRDFTTFLDTHNPDVKYRHAANTGGVLNQDLNAHFDLIRPGIGLYGYAPSLDTNKVLDLRPAMKLISRIIFVKNIPTGESVGYNATWTAKQPSKIATVRIGYADGYHRLLSNRSSMIVHSQTMPVVGRISMDQTTLNATGHDDIEVDNAVTVFGTPLITAQTVATWAETNSYEILTSVANRVARVYKEAK